MEIGYQQSPENQPRCPGIPSTRADMCVQLYVDIITHTPLPIIIHNTAIYDKDLALLSRALRVLFYDAHPQGTQTLRMHSVKIPWLVPFVACEFSA